jgi:hypothetical protein
MQPRQATGRDVAVNERALVADCKTEPDVSSLAFIEELICHPERSLPRFFAANDVERSAVVLQRISNWPHKESTKCQGTTLVVPNEAP